MLELPFFGLLGVMVLTTLVLKGIFCWLHFYKPSSWEKGVKMEKKSKELSVSRSELVHMEIPMEDIGRTSTPVPKDEKDKSFDSHIDV